MVEEENLLIVTPWWRRKNRDFESMMEKSESINCDGVTLQEKKILMAG